MYTEQRNNKKLKQLYQKALGVKSAIPHPRVQGIIRECGGKMHMHDQNWPEAATDFFEVSAHTAECVRSSSSNLICLFCFVGQGVPAVMHGALPPLLHVMHVPAGCVWLDLCVAGVNLPAQLYFALQTNVNQTGRLDNGLTDPCASVPFLLLLFVCSGLQKL